MCFLLYVAADGALPDIPFQAQSPGLSFQQLTDHEHRVADKFSLTQVKNLGSSHGCGCGFRHLSFQNGEWPEACLIGQDAGLGEGSEKDHEALFAFLSEQLKRNPVVELYGCWDGDFYHLFFA